jgi:hypothetical protein
VHFFGLFPVVIGSHKPDERLAGPDFVEHLHWCPTQLLAYGTLLCGFYILLLLLHVYF